MKRAHLLWFFCLICLSCFVLMLYLYGSLNYISRKNLRKFIKDLTVDAVSQQETSTSISVSLTHQLNHDISKDCEAILKGDAKGIAKLQKHKNFPWRDVTTDEQVLQFAQNCTFLKMKYRFPPFFIPTVTTEELDFPIAYTMLAHKNVNQILVLLSAIYREHNIHCVHLDAKSSPKTYEALKRALRCFPNIVTSSVRKKVIYAHVSRLEADIVCMKDMLRLSQPGVKWRYLINLCSQDFPLKTNFEIVKQLKELRGQNSIAGIVNIDEATRKRTNFIHKLSLVSNRYFQIRRTKKRHSPPPQNLTIVKNLAYNLYTRGFLKWALLEGKIGPALLKWSQDTYSPDEHFWFMLNRHPDAPGGSISPSRPLARFITWKGATCHGKWIHGICVFGAKDIQYLMNKQQLFVNKFDITRDSSGPICIRQQLDERAIIKTLPAT